MMGDEDDDEEGEDQKYMQESQNIVDEDGEHEVSINLEDAIATAEEMNKRGELQ